MKKTKLFLLLPLLLASCQKTKDSSSFLPSAPTTPEKRLIVNAPGREDEVYQSVSGDESAPSHPIIQGLLFDGWYTQRVGGDRFDFNTSRAVPDNLYAHWIDFSNKTDAEYLAAFVSLLTDLSGTVNHLIGESSYSIAYAIAGKTASLPIAMKITSFRQRTIHLIMPRTTIRSEMKTKEGLQKK